MTQKLVEGKYYDVCDFCGEIYELTDDLVVKYEGKHPYCEVNEPHIHSKQALPICKKCMRGGKIDDAKRKRS